MGNRTSPFGIPLRLAVLLLPFLFGCLVTLRVVDWGRRAETLLQVAQVADEPLAGPPIPSPAGSDLIVIDRERQPLAASRDGEPRATAVALEARIADLVPEKYRSLVVTTAQRHNLDPRLIAAVGTVETRFDRTVVGTHGEVGLMQIMADTGAWLARLAKLDTYDLRDDATSLDLGALYLEVLVREYGSVEKALAVYNGGPRAAAGWETNIYVQRVLQYYRGG